MLSSSYRLGLCQIAVTGSKATNLERAAAAVASAAAEGADVVVLPECFNSPYGTQYFADYAEQLGPGSPSYDALSSMAQQHQITLFGGSIPEAVAEPPADQEDPGLAPTPPVLYNTAVVFGPDGAELGRHRKAHLFDIDVPGKIKFTESDTLSPGDAVSVIDTPVGRFGLGICYDVRFPDYAAAAAAAGAHALIYPGAFNMTTGPLHWELLLRSRATDNQVYVAGVSPARDTEASYVAWGHSTLVDAWGRVVGALEAEPGVVVLDVDPQAIADVRASIPISSQKRPDVYANVSIQ